jgi:hypothetical protein
VLSRASASFVASARRSQLWKALLILSEHGKTLLEASTISEILGLAHSANQKLGDQGMI